MIQEATLPDAAVSTSRNEKVMRVASETSAAMSAATTAVNSTPLPSSTWAHPITKENTADLYRSEMIEYVGKYNTIITWPLVYKGNTVVISAKYNRLT